MKLKPEYVSGKQVQEMIGCTVDTLICSSDLPRYRIGSCVRYKFSEVMDAVESCKEESQRMVS